MWKNNQFEHGFLVLVSHNVKPAIATHKELEFFPHSGIIPPQALAAAEDEITKSLLQEGDLVMVHRGEMQGRVRIITRVDVDSNEALVQFETSNIETSIHTSNLRKSIKLGDCVSVVGGDDHGRGRPDLSQALLVEKIPNYRKEAAQAMEKLREENTKKEILYDDKVKVEIAVTLKREEVHLSHLADRDDPDHLPFLQVMPHAQLQREPREAMAIPLLNMPLTLSTPIPSPYLDPKLKVKVRVHNTKPVLDDPGFRNSDFEGLTGLWKAGDNDMPGFAKITFMVPRVRTEKIPERYVTPLQLTRQKELVIADDVFTHIVYYVLKVASDKCHVRDHEDCNKKNFHELPTGTLAVVLLL
ncbi:hypothetical protein DXG01_017033 [Tephrocybe rancida]|nr:hypothetical protein DXG01_017033 [Tephrocybe rancida]